MLLTLCHRRLVLQTSPQAEVVRAASPQPGAHPVSGEASVDSEQQPAQAVGQQGGRTLRPQLHDSAASGSSSDVDQVNTVADFLTRKDTANINEASHISADAAKPTSGEADRASAQMAPFEARKTFLLGPPKPACCPERSRTAEGINKLRWADDPDIGEPPTLFPWHAVQLSHVSPPTLHFLAVANLQTNDRMLVLADFLVAYHVFHFPATHLCYVFDIDCPLFSAVRLLAETSDSAARISWDYTPRNPMRLHGV